MGRTVMEKMGKREEGNGRICNGFNGGEISVRVEEMGRT